MAKSVDCEGGREEIALNSIREWAPEGRKEEKGGVGEREREKR